MGRIFLCDSGIKAESEGEGKTLRRREGETGSGGGLEWWKAEGGEKGRLGDFEKRRSGNLDPPASLCEALRAGTLRRGDWERKKRRHVTSKRVAFGVKEGCPWGQREVPLGSMRSAFGVKEGAFGVNERCLWGQREVPLGAKRGAFGGKEGCLWGQREVPLGAKRGAFGGQRGWTLGDQ